MQVLAVDKEQILNDGFTIVDDIYTADEIGQIIKLIDETDQSNISFRNAGGLFAIRRFLYQIPKAKDILFNSKLKQLIANTFGNEFFIMKAIYFDKPEQSNWFVSRHQDLTIAVKNKVDVNGYGSWTKKEQNYAVQPPANILKDNFTIRIHLDNTDENNGALRVIPGSHLLGIYRPETINQETVIEKIAKVKQGGMMMMRPLLMHASSRTTSNSRRRVIHLEFSRSVLPNGLEWAEKMAI